MSVGSEREAIYCPEALITCCSCYCFLIVLSSCGVLFAVNLFGPLLVFPLSQDLPLTSYLSEASIELGDFDVKGKGDDADSWFDVKFKGGANTA